MSKSRFDSSQMLPLFQIIAPSSHMTNVNQMEQSVESNLSQKHKKKSKRPDVPVHKSHNIESASNDKVTIHKKTFGANHHSHRNKHKHEKVMQSNEDLYAIENKIFEDNTDSQKIRISRKHLMKEFDRISLENQSLQEQLSSVQQTVIKRESQVSKYKEKLSSLQNFNKEVLNENNIIKTQYQDIIVNLEEFKTQLQHKKCSSCEKLKTVLTKYNKEIETANKANKDLNDDLNMLKNVIYRLNVQLERYQEKLRKSNGLTFSNNTLNASLEELDLTDNQNINNIVSQTLQPESVLQHSDHLHTPISWGNANSHTLGPLLDAYQDAINEKDEIIKKYESELTEFTGKLKTVIEENEILHKKNIESEKLLNKNLLELEKNAAELKLTKDQNDLLIKKCALKHDKLQEICKIYDHKIETMRRDYDVLQEQYHQTRVEFSGVQAKCQSLENAYDTLKSDKQNVIPLAVHITSVNECKRLFEELKVQYDNEKTKLLNQIKLLEQQTSEFETKLVEIGAEKRELLIKVKSLEKQLKKIEHKLIDTQNSLTHTQISREACKRQLGKAVEFGRELVNEQESLLQQLSTRQKENKAVKQIGSNIANRMDILRSQLKTVQKDAFHQLASVEQRIQEQDSSLETMRRDHEIEIDKMLRDIRDKDDCIARLVEQNSAIPAAPYLLYREKHMHFTS